MPIFKPKTSKQIQVDTKSTTTLDSKHSTICEGFEMDAQKIKDMKKEKKRLMKQINNDDLKLSLKLDYQDRVTEIKKEIKFLENRKTQYFLDNSKLVFEYFEEKKKISEVGTEKSDTHATQRVNSFFKIPDKDSGDSSQSALTSSSSNKPSVVQQYLSNVDNEFLDMSRYSYANDQCPRCQNGELVKIEHEGVAVCNACAYRVPILIENEKPSYKEPPKEVCFYAYKRINHFREILAQFQAKETTQIPDEVLENIRRQIQKERIELITLTNRKAKDILKKLGYNKYYEHIPFIKDKLGIKPPVMTPELEETLCSLFMDIQGPYAKYIPDNRVNFLNYYYTVYKLCELLDQTQFLPYFPMLKDIGKRIEQDTIWKLICEDLNWEFIPTV